MADNDDSLQDFKSDPSQLIERETHALAEFDRDFHPDGSRDDQDNPLDQTSNAQASGGGKMSSIDLVCPEDDLYDESLSKESLSEAGQDSLDTMLEFIQHSSLSVAEAAFNQLTQGEYASIEPLANSFSKPQAGSERLSSEEESEISKEDFPNTETSCESVSQEGGLEAKHQKNKKEHLNPTCTNSYKKLNNNLDEVKSEDGNDVYSSNSPYFDEAPKKSDSYFSNQANEWEHLGARPKHRPPKKYNNSLDSSSPVDLIPPQVVEPVAHGVHNPLLPEHLEDKKVGHEYWEWMVSDEVGLLSRLPDTETRETLKDIPQHTQFAFLLDQMNELKEKVEQLTKKVKLQEEEILALKLQRHEKNIFQPHTEDTREREPCTTRGSSSDFYHKKGNLRNETHLVDKSGSFRHHRLIEISNSLSESELQRLKGLVQPKLDSFRLAKIREGSELFQELESRGELSCTSVRDLLEKIHRFDLAEKLGSSSHGSDELSERDFDSLQEGGHEEEECETVCDADDRKSDELEKSRGMTACIEGEEEVSVGNYSNKTDAGTSTGEDLYESGSVISLQQENMAGLNQDFFSLGGTSTWNSISGARNTDQIDTVIDQSNSYVSNRSNEWEHLGARPKHRPPKDAKDPPAEASSHHSLLVDPGPLQMNEFLYYNNAEKDLSPQGASYVEGMMNLADSKKAKPYFGDCQVISRPDPIYCQSHSSFNPLTGGTSVQGNDTSASLESTDNSQLELEEEEAFALVERVRERGERGEFCQEIEKIERGKQPERVQKKKEREACPEAIGTPLSQEERYIKMPGTCNVESLNSTNNSPLAFVQGVRDAQRKVSARNLLFRRWWCTCSVQYDQDAGPAICTTCNKYRYLGPCRVRVQSCYDECCICQMHTSSGLHILPCLHRAHMECIIRLIQHNILHCPSCFGAFFPSS